MVTVPSSDADVLSLSEEDQTRLAQGEVVLSGQGGQYQAWARIAAPPEQVWRVLTNYERFPDFLTSVAACKILERDGNRTLVERQDRRKIGWMPIKICLVTENLEHPRDRIDYRLIKGNLDSMEGSWQLTPVEASTPTTLLVQTIHATASLGPLQGYFFTVFEQGVRETMTALRQEMERQEMELIPPGDS